jgi:predicted flap endonuclease-1-like 5' DNA nuclease
MTSIITIEGIGEKYSQSLQKEGIRTTEKLLEAGATPKGRQELAQKTGVSDSLILKWVNRADLFRIKGIGEEYSDLLEAAGVDTVPELAQRNPANLYEALEATNAKKKLVRQLPTRVQVESWVDQAKALPRAVSY